MTLYSNAPNDYQCPFCLLRDGIINDHTLSRDSDIVYRTERVIAFVASHQWQGNYPNVLVIPTEHHENLYSMPADFGTDIQQAMQLVALAFKAIYNCDGVSTRQHNEPAGYQDVWHYHMHVTPRYRDDYFYANAGKNKKFMPEDERKPFAHALKIEIKNRLKS